MRTTVETFPLARESKATHDAPACRGPQTWPVAASRVAFGSRATLVRLYFASKSIAARIPTPRNRAARTARLADLLARYSPRAGKALLGEGKGGNR